MIHFHYSHTSVKTGWLINGFRRQHRSGYLDGSCYQVYLRQRRCDQSEWRTERHWSRTAGCSTEGFSLIGCCLTPHVRCCVMSSQKSIRGLHSMSVGLKVEITMCVSVCVGLCLCVRGTVLWRTVCPCRLNTWSLIRISSRLELGLGQE